MAKSRLKMTPVIRELSKVTSRVQKIRPREIPGNRTPIVRLGVAYTQPTSFTPARLIEHILSFAPETIFLCDTNIFIAPNHDSLWESLFSKQLSVTRGVKKELSSWLRSPTHNHLAHGEFQKMTTGDTSSRMSLLSFQSLDGDHTFDRALTYYVNVLGSRKLLAHLVESSLAKELKRTPSPAELESCLKRDFGERGYQLAMEGRSKINGEHFYSDEELVVSAFLYAIATGSEVVILTRDADVQDQFYKMHLLLKMHYSAMYVADFVAAMPKAIKRRYISRDDRHFDSVFRGSGNFLLECPIEMLDAVLPRDYESIPVYCWFLSGPNDNLRVCENVCHCELGLQRLLELKANTQGQNTDRLDEKNLHVRLAVGGVGGHWGAVATDKVIPRPKINMVCLDMYTALLNKEESTTIDWKNVPEQ